MAYTYKGYTGLGATKPEDPAATPTPTATAQTMTASPAPTAPPPPTAAPLPTGLGATSTTVTPSAPGTYTPSATTGYVEKDDNVGAIAAEMMGQDNILMQKAAAEGQATAAARGLGNSSIAATAGQSAMLEQIVPIASQESAQRYGKNLSNQEFQQSSALGEQETASQSKLSEQEYQQSRGLQEQKYGYDSALSQQDYQQTKDLAYQDWTFDRDLMKLDFQQQQVLNEQGFNYDKELQRLDQTWQTAIKEMELDMEAAGQADTAVANAHNDYTTEVQAIMSNKDLTAQQRQQQLDAAEERMLDRLNAVDLVYGSENSYDMNVNSFTKDNDSYESNPTKAAPVTTAERSLDADGKVVTSGKWPGETWENGDTPQRGDTRITSNGTKQVYKDGQWITWGSEGSTSTASGSGFTVQK